jgi:hypothetical protein
MLRTFSGDNIVLLAFIIKTVVENTCSLGVDVPITVFRSLRVFSLIFGFLLLPRQKRLRGYLTNYKQNKNKYENLIFVQNRFRRRRLGNFKKFHCVGGAAAALISYRRRRLGNFQNFRHLGGGGCVFFEKIGGDGGSANRLTPLDMNANVLSLINFRVS